MPRYRNSDNIILDIVTEYGQDRKPELMKELKKLKTHIRGEIVSRLRVNIRKYLDKL